MLKTKEKWKFDKCPACGSSDCKTLIEHRCNVCKESFWQFPGKADSSDIHTAPSPAARMMDQPLVTDSNGVLRFKENRIVRKLLEHSRLQGYGLNEAACDDFTPEEWMQLAQLIGYSLSGYADLSYVTDEAYNRAAAAAAAGASDAGT